MDSAGPVLVEIFRRTNMLSSFFY